MKLTLAILATIMVVLSICLAIVYTYFGCWVIWPLWTISGGIWGAVAGFAWADALNE